MPATLAYSEAVERQRKGLVRECMQGLTALFARYELFISGRFWQIAVGWHKSENYEDRGRASTRPLFWWYVVHVRQLALLA
ncbi:MAG: hypothetical protein DMG40_14580 [Acidobacteria bacterium]|nr:MAG: hypothetical protein DMG40_14580 [Acidobacteriota bacterium]